MNVTGDSPHMAMPADSGIHQKYKKFQVKPETFKRFETGKVKFSKWGSYLNMEDSAEKEIYDYVKSNRDAVVVLVDDSTGAIRSIRHRKKCEC